jgi:tetratricopeptide (TPR) repeat protein
LYNNVGSIYDSKGDYEKALEYYNRALAIREKVFGTEHPDVATSYNNIGNIYYSQGDYEKAQEYLKKALAIFEKVLGTEHPNVAQLYNNIGFIYRSQGNYRKALEYYKKTLAIFEKILGAENEKTLLIRQEIMALTAYDREAMKEHLFTITTVNGNTPAKQQGMDGEYIVLEFADWTINSATSLFDKNNELRGKPKTLVVIKDGKITKHYFENVIGASIGLKQVGKEKKDEIVRLYEEWKAGEAE